MTIQSNNLINTSVIPKAGQRVIEISPGVWIPVGFGGNFEPGSSSQPIYLVGNKLYVYNKDTGEYEFISIINYSAFEVYATNEEIPAGTEDEDTGLTYTNAVPANMIEAFKLRTDTPKEDSDVIVYWGDDTFTKLSELPDDRINLVDDADCEEIVYTLRHEYTTPGKYIVMIYGKDYWGINHTQYYILASGNFESGVDYYSREINSTSHKYKYTKIATSEYTIGSSIEDYIEEHGGVYLSCPISNIISRIFDDDLPIAPNATNFASLCSTSHKLLGVNVPTGQDLFTHIHNASSLFTNCDNLIYLNNFETKFAFTRIVSNACKGCTSLKYSDWKLPVLSPYAGTSGCASMYEGCTNLGSTWTNLVGDEVKCYIENFIPSGGFASKLIGIKNCFKNCSSLTASNFGSITKYLWEDITKDFVATDCFKGCTNLVSQVPTSWGGTNSTIQGYIDSHKYYQDLMPVASSNTVGGVKVDGTTITVNSSGLISVNTDLIGGGGSGSGTSLNGYGNKNLDEVSISSGNYNLVGGYACEVTDYVGSDSTGGSYLILKSLGNESDDYEAGTDSDIDWTKIEQGSTIYYVTRSMDDVNFIERTVTGVDTTNSKIYINKRLTTESRNYTEVTTGTFASGTDYYTQSSNEVTKEIIYILIGSYSSGEYVTNGSRYWLLTSNFTYDGSTLPSGSNSTEITSSLSTLTSGNTYNANTYVTNGTKYWKLTSSFTYDGTTLPDSSNSVRITIKELLGYTVGDSIPDFITSHGKVYTCSISTNNVEDGNNQGDFISVYFDQRGTNQSSYVFGYRSASVGNLSFSAGVYVYNAGIGSFVIGADSSNTGEFSVLGGIGNQNDSGNSILFGANNKADTNATGSVLLGLANESITDSTLDPQCISQSNTLIGCMNKGYGTNGFSVGTSNEVYGPSIAIGRSIKSYQKSRQSIGVGSNLLIYSENSFVIGTNSTIHEYEGNFPTVTDYTETVTGAYDYVGRGYDTSGLHNKEAFIIVSGMSGEKNNYNGIARFSKYEWKPNNALFSLATGSARKSSNYPAMLLYPNYKWDFDGELHQTFVVSELVEGTDASIDPKFTTTKHDAGRVKSCDAGIELASAASVELDFKKSSRFKIKNTNSYSGSTVPTLSNFIDGSEADLLIYGGVNTSFDANWNTDTVENMSSASSSSFAFYKIYKIDNSIILQFIRKVII